MIKKVDILEKEIKTLDISDNKKDEILEIIKKIKKDEIKNEFKTKMLQENANTSKTLLNNIISEIEKKNRIILEINKELEAADEEFRQNNEELQLLNENIYNQKNIIEEKELRLKTIIENQGEGFGITDFNENFTFANSRACEIFGVAKGKLKGRNLREFLDNKEWNDIKQQSEKRKQNIRSNYELKIKLPNNAEKFLFVITAPDFNENKEIIGTIGTFRDVTDLKKAEQAIKISEEKYRILFEKSNDAILLIDENLFVDCNMSAVKMFGFKNKKDLLMMHPSEISPEEQSRGIASFKKAEEMMMIAYEEGINKFEWMHKRTNGEIFPAVVWLTAIPFKNKQTIHVVVRDLTESKNAERKLKLQKEKIENAHKDITDSINYAKRIQQALLPTEKTFDESFSEHFILYMPRDVVSGDFYWAKSIYFQTTGDAGVAFVVADCTGHGVPGAFLSMLGISFLNEIVRTHVAENAGDTLNHLREMVKTSLKQTGEYYEQKDGMDMVFCTINKNTLELIYAGANNPLYIVRKQNLSESGIYDSISRLDENSAIRIYSLSQDNNTKLNNNNQGEDSYYLIEIKPDRQPIGIYLKENPFTKHEIQLQKGDIIYAFSDGYVDQFSGKTKDKFKLKPFRNMLLSNAHKPLAEQKQILEQTFNDWKGDFDQIDDVLILGVKI